MDPAGRHIVITGAASGIGRACALAFADQGARVTVSDVNVDGAIATADEINGHAIAADVGREDDIADLIAHAEQANGPIDAFFSNAGITGPPGGPPELSNDDWDLLWRVNVQSHIWAAKQLIPKMLERGEGYLLSTASAAGLLSQLGALGYAATKHAAVAVAEWIDITYRDRGDPGRLPVPAVREHADGHRGARRRQAAADRATSSSPSRSPTTSSRRCARSAS